MAKKKNIDILDGNQCAAWGARLAKVDYIPSYPITPQTEIIETIAKWKADGDFKGIFQQVDSEHSVMSAALGSAATGARTFTASSSQGLLLMHEVLVNVSGTRLPMVFVNVSRALSAPISLWCDLNDMFAMRDAGWIMIICETNQEVLDSVIMGYKISENNKVLLPVFVNMDGFIHSFTREEVAIPNQKIVDKFIPKQELEVKLDINNPKTLAIPSLDGYMGFRAQVHKAMMDSTKYINQTHRQWEKLTGRKYDFFEDYKLKGAEEVIVMLGANTTIAKSAVDNLRKQGRKVGLLRVRVLRPLNEELLKKMLKNAKHIGVVDQNIAPGLSGILFPEIKSAIFGLNVKVSNYIAGLGGKPVQDKEFIEIFDELKKGKENRKWLM
jgi:pyruvate ferredoxin oxidoreductase alpha subunit